MLASSPAAPPRTGAELVAAILCRTELSQAELARRAGIPRSVMNVYARGRREPGADALLRIVSAAGLRLDLSERKPPVDPERAGRILVQVLDLAEALPFRPRAELGYPHLPDRVSGAKAAA